MNPISTLIAAIAFVIGLAYVAFNMTFVDPGQLLGELRTDSPVEAVVAQKVGPANFEIFTEQGLTLPKVLARALLKPNEFSKMRRVEFETFVDPRSLLAEGEALPSGEMRDLMVAARSARLADAACEKLIGVIAADCGVTRFSTSRINARKYDDEKMAAHRRAFVGHYVMDVVMVFTPLAPVGTFPDAARVTYVEKTVDLEELRLKAPSAAAMDALLERVMAAATRSCNEIREAHGACVITNIHIGMGYYRHEGYGPNSESYYQPIRNSFELAWFSPIQDVATEAEETQSAGAPNT